MKIKPFFFTFVLLTQSRRKKVTLRVTNKKSKNLLRVTKSQKIHFRVTNSKLKNKKLHFALLTRRLNFYLFTFELPA